MSRPAVRVFLSGLALCLGSAAQAQVLGTASVVGLKIILTDLDPGDGIAPSLTWVGEGANQGVVYGGDLLESEGGGYSTTNSFYKQLDEAGEWGEQLRIGTTLYSAGMGASGLDASFDAAFGVEYSGQISHRRDFTLTPNTAVTFQAKVATNLLATIPAHDAHSTAPYPFVPDVRASFRGFLDSHIEGGPSGFSQLSREFEFFHADIGLNTASDQDVLLVTVSNKGARSADGTLAALAGFNVHTRPIPEPSTWMLMALGLAALAFRAERRRQLAPACAA